jgi:hypothetical protein
MHRNDNQSSNLVAAGVAGVGALIAATLSAYVLSGIEQAFALAICFTVMGASILVSLAEQRRLENVTTSKVGDASKSVLDRAAASGGVRVSPFPGI